jgi:UPF0755 protein
MGVNSMLNFNRKRRSFPKVLTIVVMGLFIAILAGGISLIYLFPQTIVNNMPYQTLEYMPKPIQQYYQAQLEPLDSFDTQTKIISIRRGWAANKIAQHLADEKIIKNSNAFLIYTQSLNRGAILKAGDYKLSPSMTVEELTGILSDGKIFVDTIRVTIPEGFELRQMKEKFVIMGLVEEEELDQALNKKYDYWFLQHMDEKNYNLEGYLFPDTYEFQRDASGEYIVDTMLKRFDMVFTEQYKEKAKELGMSVEEIIILASIIEREAVVERERPIISGVFHNRLGINMMLQSCATVQYVLGERKPILSYDDIKINSPYNTYTNYGLPPTPIASPGQASIQAALYPQKSDYLFFVAKRDGSHTFTKTYEEHLRAQRNNN